MKFWHHFSILLNFHLKHLERLMNTCTCCGQGIMGEAAHSNRHGDFCSAQCLRDFTEDIPKVAAAWPPDSIFAQTDPHPELWPK